MVNRLLTDKMLMENIQTSTYLGNSQALSILSHILPTGLSSTCPVFTDFLIHPLFFFFFPMPHVYSPIDVLSHLASLPKSTTWIQKSYFQVCFKGNPNQHSSFHGLFWRMRLKSLILTSISGSSFQSLTTKDKSFKVYSKNKSL